MPRLLTKLKLDDGGFYRNWSCDEILKKRTVIFGRNGCGKSTLVRHLGAMNEPEPPPELTINAETDLEILVFNEDYVQKNLGGVLTDSGLSTALFVTGSVNVETEAEFKAATQRRDRVDRLVSQASRILRPRETALGKTKETARNDVRSLHKKFGAVTAPTAEQKLRDAIHCSDGDDTADRQTLTSDLASVPDAINGIPDALVNVDVSEIGDVLSRDVAADASSALSGLTAEQRSWVEKGAELHEHRETCLLCENVLLPPRSELLAALRTKELLQLRGDLQRLRTTLEGQADAIAPLITGLTEKVKRVDTSTVDLDGVSNELRAARSYLEALSECVEQKTSQPQQTVQLPDEDPPSTPLFDQLRVIIGTQNKQWEQQRNDLGTEQELALARCLGRLGATHLAQIDSAESSVKFAQQRVESLKAELERLDERIKKTQARRLRTDDAGPLARRLTNDLRSYLGHNELTVKAEIEGDATGFALYRSNGYRARGLSEGEQTAISLLHFITSLRESNRVSKLHQTCVVLDDPVSSLDGQSIRNAYHFIVNALHNGHGADRVGQYLIFTHNEAFFGLWRDKLTDQSGKVGSLNALLRLDTRQSDVGGQRGPILEAFPPGAIKYRSEYYRLFDQVAKEVEQQSNFIDQGVANVARRLMESFARWKGPNANNLRNSFERLVSQASSDDHVERFGSVLQFLQSGSHFDEIDIDSEAESVSNYRDDVVACLALMRAADSTHFEGMFRAVRADDGADVSEQFTRICAVLDRHLPLRNADSSGAPS